MEKVLLKMARQLCAFDEASIMALWERYAQQVTSFEPSKRWEEAVLVFGMIQAMRFKNQLFNHHWSAGEAPAKGEGTDRAVIQAQESSGEATVYDIEIVYAKKLPAGKTHGLLEDR